MLSKKLVNLSQYGLISILPHDNADVDAILSSILLSKLLNFIGIPNEILIFDKKISKDTKYILDILGIDVTKFFIKEESIDKNLFLIDHYETLHSGKVVGCFDHHANLKTLSYYIYDYRITCATACIVYSYMLEVQMPITKEIIEMLAYAMLVDTIGFLSNKTVEKEALELPKLLKEYNLDFDKIRDISYLYTDLNSMDIDEIITNGLKKYIFKNGKVNASYIQIKNYENNFDSELYNDIVSEIQKRITDEGIAVWIYAIYALNEKMTYILYIYQNHVVTVPSDKILSRGDDIMPEIEKLYD